MRGRGKTGPVLLFLVIGLVEGAGCSCAKNNESSLVPFVPEVFENGELRDAPELYAEKSFRVGLAIALTDMGYEFQITNQRAVVTVPKGNPLGEGPDFRINITLKAIEYSGAYDHWRAAEQTEFVLPRAR